MGVRAGRAVAAVEPERRLARRAEPRARLVARAERVPERRERRLVEADARVDVLHLQSDVVVHGDLLSMEATLDESRRGDLGGSCGGASGRAEAEGLADALDRGVEPVRLAEPRQRLRVQPERWEAPPSPRGNGMSATGSTTRRAAAR